MRTRPLAPPVRLLPVALLAAATACRSAAPAPGDPVVTTVTPATAEAAGFSSELLFASDALSAHRAVAAVRLAPHLHEHHAETVYVVAGRARMLVGERWIELEPGALVHLPAGTVHAVEPYEPTTVLSLFTPPFDGVDRVFLAPATSP